MNHRHPFTSIRNRRMALATQAAFDYLIMPSLLALRSTCRDDYITVNIHLRGSLHALLSRFVPDPKAFLQMITPWGALIVGEAALSHILHDPTLCKASLEIAIGNLYFHPFLNSMSRILPHDALLATRVVKPAPMGFPFHRHITRIAEYRLSSGLVVVVYESSSPSPCDVVSGYWTTALMNFVTGFSLGCAYPRLTFNRFTLRSDTRSDFLSWSDRDMSRRLELYGFNSELRCDLWSLSARGRTDTPSPVVGGCGKSLYVCPLQGRYFGDPGSLVMFYDGFSVDLDELRTLCVAPYGPMVTWRLPSNETCQGNCIETDPVLPPFIVSMLTQFIEGSHGFVRSHQLFHTISDARSHSPVVSPPAPHQGRRYSL